MQQIKQLRKRLTSDNSLRQINALLLLLIILINGYIIIAPLVPRINYEVKQRITKPVDIYTQNPTATIDRSKNHLIIPALQLDEPILDSTDPGIVHQGIWRRPNTSTPEKGSNTVLVGHRFTYDGAAVFYNLDKLATGNDVFVVYDQKIYRFRIEKFAIVPPTAVDVEEPTTDTVLTLYTCTPLLTAKDRLVYRANLMETL